MATETMHARARSSRLRRALRPLTSFFRREGCIFTFEAAALAPEKPTRGPRRSIEALRAIRA
jgi:hypothetical protein